MRKIPNLRHLRAFREVVREKSISLAAKKVYLSQPAITQAIAKLEEMLDAPLFERRNDGMYPTEPGTLFQIRVDRALTHIETGTREALRLGGKKGGRGFANFDQLLTAAQLRALAAIAGAGNFSLAARAIGVSQPALHRAARDLERLAGIALFTKTGQGIVLTRAADVLTQHAKLAFAELEQGFEEIGGWRGHDTAVITVGSMPLPRSFLLPSAINSLMRGSPDVRVRVVDGPYDDLLSGLRQGDLDMLVGAMREPVPIEDVMQEPLFQDPLAVVARSGHPLARKRHVSIGDLIEYPWVLPRVGAPTRELFERAFRDVEGLNLSGVIEASSLILIRELLIGSNRLTFISAHQVRHEQSLGLLAVLNVDMPRVSRPIGLTVRRDWRPTATQARFLHLLRRAGRSLDYGRANPFLFEN